jgi:hypothetical protein
VGFWAGRAPGLVGVDQVNVQVPPTIREGRAVPLQVDAGSSSAPVTIAIHSGGGRCADPPSAGFGQIAWEKTVTTSVSSTGAASTAETDTLIVSLQASPGKQAPTAQATTGATENFFGPSCPISGYRSLDAGSFVSIQGPGLNAMQAPVVSLQSGQVSGLTVYQSTLPSGTIQPGSFSVSAAGGSDVGSFQSSVPIGSPIQITTPLAGMSFPSVNTSLTINWTGGE